MVVIVIMVVIVVVVVICHAGVLDRHFRYSNYLIFKLFYAKSREEANDMYNFFYCSLRRIFALPLFRSSS